MAQPRKRPKPLSEDRLRAAAVRYLARFAASRAQVLQVLDRKIKRDLVRCGEEAGSDVVEAAALWQMAAQKIVADLARQGFLDDRRFAEGRARSLLAAGRPLRRVRDDLRARGVAPEVIEAVLDDLKNTAEGAALDSDALDRAAAIRFARRRRLGPYATARPPGEERQAAHRKALAAFARAGFSYHLAKAVLTAEDETAPPDACEE